MSSPVTQELHTAPRLILRTPLFFVAGREPSEKIAYAPLRRLAFSVNDAGEELLRALQEGLAPESIEPGFEPFIGALERMGLFEELPDSPPSAAEALPDTYRPTSVSLFLTGKCNLHCSYCYAKGGDTDALMTRDVAQAALDFVLQNAVETGQPRVQVIFHGDGEPTLAWSVMRWSIEYTEARCVELGLRCSFEAGTNGIISEERLRWLAPRLENLTVSLDGPPDIQDAQRPLTSARAARRAEDLKEGNEERFSDEGKDSGRDSSSHIVERTLRVLDELGVNYALRCTITRRSVERIPEVIKYICGVSGARQIQLEPIFPVGRALQTGDEAVDPEAFVRGFLAGRLVARSYGRRLIYAAARADQITNRFCEAITGAFNVTQDGRVTSCYEVFEASDPRYEYFGIGGFDPQRGTFGVDLEKVRAASKWTAAEKAPCRECFAKYHCAGDCSAKVAATGDPASGINPNRCYVIRELTRAQIFSLYGFGDVREPSGGWQLQDASPAPLRLVQISGLKSAPRA